MTGLVNDLSPGGSVGSALMRDRHWLTPERARDYSWLLRLAWLAPLVMAPIQTLTLVHLGFPALLLALLAALRRAVRDPVGLRVSLLGHPAGWLKSNTNRPCSQ